MERESKIEGEDGDGGKEERNKTRAKGERAMAEQYWEMEMRARIRKTT